MYYTARLRTHDMGVLQLGFFTFPIHFIPPRAESFLSYGLCKTEMFEEVTPGGKPGSPTPQPEPLTPHDCGLALRESASLGLAVVGRGPGFHDPGGVGREDRPGGPGRTTGVCIGPKS